MLTALSMLVTFIVPLILIEPADSMTRQKVMLLADDSETNMIQNLYGDVANNGYSKKELSDVALLIGVFTPGDYEEKLSWAKDCDSAAEVVEAAKDEYFLGIASEFSVFLEGDFHPRGADAEGRIAIGGDFSFEGGYNYQVGSGDYGTMTALFNTDNYKGITDFAHAIVNGKVMKMNTVSTVGAGSGYDKRPDVSNLYIQGSGDSLTVYYPENEDMYKRIVIGNSSQINSCEHISWQGGYHVAQYGNACQHDKYSLNELAQFYQADLIDFTETFTWIKEQSEKLSRKRAVGAEKGNTSINDSKTVVTFDGPGKDSKVETIYFNLDSWESSIKEIRFENVPENANLVINCGGEEIKIDDIDPDDNVNNFDGNNTTHYKDRIKTFVNGEMISNNDTNASNNNVKSEQILYNFYQATKVYIDVNFNGTILSPNADVKSDEACHGHLSGSLIAQSFDGGLEFGYRPYRGGTNILGSTAGYVMPFDKFVNDFDDKECDDRLSGATFITYELDDDNNKVIVNRWKSKDDTSYITIPTNIDFQGTTKYDISNNIKNNTYYIEEEKAPDGYVKTDKKYRVEINEKINLDYIIETDEGDIPTIINVNFDLYEDGSDTPIYSSEMKIKDIYSDGVVLQRIICIGDEYFVLDVIGTGIEVGLADLAGDVFLTNSQPINLEMIDILEDETSSEGETDSNEKQEPSYTIPTDLTATYGDKLSNVKFPNENEGTWSWKTDDSNVTVGDVGTNTFTAVFTPYDNNFKTVEASVNITVEQATPSYTLPTGLTARYGDKLSDVGLPIENNGTWSWKTDDPDVTVGNVGTNPFTAVFTPNDINNYKSVEVSVNVDVGKADSSYVVPTGLTASYGNKLSDVNLPSNVEGGYWSWKDNNISVGDVGTNTFTAVFTPKDQNNYNSVDVNIEVKVDPINPEIPSDLSATYGDKLSNVKFPNVDYGEWSWVADNPNDIEVGNVGIQKFKAKFNSNTNNYNSVESEIQITVNPAIPVVNPVCNTEGLKQWDSLPEIITSEGDTEGTIRWKNSDAKIQNGTNILSWEFIPESNNFETISGTITIKVEPVLIEKDTIDVSSNVILDGDYYYDPTSMMVMPLPEETPNFINQYAIVFKKVSEGKLLTGADIKLQKKDDISGDFIDVNIPSWNWTDKPSSDDISVDQIEENKVYRFYEDESPDVEKYEKANPIYFKREGLTIKYTDVETDLSDDSKWNELNLADGQYTITMDDKYIYGPEVKLAKYKYADDAITDEKLSNATFQLYAVNGNLEIPVYPVDAESKKILETELITIGDNDLNLTELLKNNEEKCNSDYIKNGYLIPGAYYLKEINSPEGYDATSDKLYFTISEDETNGNYTITDEAPEPPGTTLVALESIPDGSSNYNIIWAVKLGDDLLNGGANVPAIPGVKSIEVKLKDNKQVSIYTNSSESSLPTTFESSITKAELNPSADLNKIVVQPAEGWNPIEIEYITIKTQSGETFTTDTSLLPPAAYTLTSDSIGLAVPSTYKSIEVRGENWDQQWFVYFNNQKMNGDGSAIEAVKEIRVTADKEIKLFSKNSTTGDILNDIRGTYSNGITTITFESAINANKIEFQAVPWSAFTINKVEVETENGIIYTTDFSAVSDENAPVEKPDIRISRIKVFYSDAEPVEVEISTPLEAAETATDDRMYPFDISNVVENKESIIGLLLNVTGSGSGKIKVKNADGQIWSKQVNFGNETTAEISLGKTEYVAPSETANSPLIDVADKIIKIGNKEKGAETDITVKKVWNDANNQNNIRPESINVTLHRYNGNQEVPFTADENITKQITLNANNNWTYKWEDLPSKIGDTHSYYTYTAIEEPVEGYTVSYTNGTNEITITNTLKTIDIPVEKIWYDNKGEQTEIHPGSVMVVLQKKNGDNTYEDVTSLRLSAENEWKAKFENLPAEGEYKIVESNVPTGWKESYKKQIIDGNAETIPTCIIENRQQVGSLNVKKNWEGDNDNNKQQRPQNVNVKVYRTITPPPGVVIAPKNTKSSDVTTDYARLLQYSLYFYDANMCGDLVEEKSILSWRRDCEVTYNNTQIEGGFHDAGDHLMFGLPQGFAASSLGWSYFENKKAFDSLGLAKHYEVIMKHFCDFFVNSTKLNGDSVESFLYQKGDFGEHNSWGPPEKNGYHTNKEWWTSDKASDIAANYAAALAQYVINFGDPDNYLDVAKALYDFSTDNNQVSTDTYVRENGVVTKGYESGGCDDEQAWAAAWLYLATKDPTYAADCDEKLTAMNKDASARDKRGYFWDREELAASIVYNAYIAEEVNDTPDWTMVSNYLSDKINPDSDEYIQLDGWASARHNALLQTIALAYDKHNNTEVYKDWALGQMKFILGENDFNTCFVIGFDENSATSPHHRAASGIEGWDTWNSGSVAGSYANIETDNVLIGALVGGPHGEAYVDKFNQVEGNEVALDYNAGLVGAAAALYDAYRGSINVGNTVTKEVMVDDGLKARKDTIYEEDAYNEYLESQQAGGYSVRSVGPVNFKAMSFRRNAVSVLADNGSGEITIQRYNHSFCSIPDLFKSKNLDLIQVYFNGSTPQDFKFQLKDWEWGEEKAKKGDYLINGNVISWEFNGITGIGSFFTDQTQSETLQNYIQKIVLSYSDGSKFEITNKSFVSTTPTITIANAPTEALKIGATHQLSASGVDSIGWLSSSDKVSVNNGVVTINGYPENGKATITAYDTTEDNVFTDNDAYDTVEISVQPLELGLTPPTIQKEEKSKIEFSYDIDGFEYSYDYSPKDENGLTISDDGEITANKTGTYVIYATVTKGDISTTIEKELVVTSNFSVALEPNVESFRLDAFKETGVEINAYNADENNGVVTYSSNHPEIIDITEDGIITLKSDAVITEQTEIIITAVNGTTSRNCTFKIIPNPIITAEKAKINIGQEITLQANNLIGNTATWTIVEGSDVIEFVSQNVGNETSITSNVSNNSTNVSITGKGYGKARIIVTDNKDNASSAEYVIEVEIIRDVVNTDGLDSVDELQITSDNNWTNSLNDLPIYDAFGNLYYYYIEEIMTNGDYIAGNGGKYIPVDYLNNGSNLNDEKILEVTNAFIANPQGQLPSTGGSGVKTYYYIGGAIMLLGIAGFTGIKRRERKRRKE